MRFENLPDLDSPAAWDPALVLTNLTGKKIFLLVAFAVLAVSALAGTLPARRLDSLHPPAKAYLGDIPLHLLQTGHIQLSLSSWEVQSYHHHQGISFCGDTQNPSGHILQGTLLEQRVGWGDLQLCLPFYPVIIIMAPGSICSSTLTSHTGSPASPVQRGGLTPVRAALPMAPRRPVAALPVAMALAHGQLGAGQGSCSPACLGWGMWGC